MKAWRKKSTKPHGYYKLKKKISKELRTDRYLIRCPHKRCWRQMDKWRQRPQLVSFIPDNSSFGLNSITVQQAIDDLYRRSMNESLEKESSST